MEAKREPGLYWVKEQGDWTIAKWHVSPDFWLVFGQNADDNYTDADFDEIDATKVERL